MSVSLGMAPAAVNETRDSRATDRAVTHVVQPGDTLAAIAKAHGVPVKALAELNSIDDPNKIRPGQELKIGRLIASAAPVPLKVEPQPEPPHPAEEGGIEMVHIHLVESGDTFSGIAKRYGVTVARLVEANPGVDPRRLRIGQKIRVARAVEEPEAGAQDVRQPVTVVVPTKPAEPETALASVAQPEVAVASSSEAAAAATPPSQPEPQDEKPEPQDGKPEPRDEKPAPAEVRVVRSEGDFVRSLGEPISRPELKRVRVGAEE